MMGKEKEEENRVSMQENLRERIDRELGWENEIGIGG